MSLLNSHPIFLCVKDATTGTSLLTGQLKTVSINGLPSLQMPSPPLSSTSTDIIALVIHLSRFSIYYLLIYLFLSVLMFIAIHVTSIKSQVTFW